MYKGPVIGWCIIVYIVLSINYALFLIDDSKSQNSFINDIYKVDLYPQDFNIGCF